MRRSTLQRKDRDELTQVATTLGKKPSSRARKGEIITSFSTWPPVVRWRERRRDRRVDDVTDATASTDTGEPRTTTPMATTISPRTTAMPASRQSPEPGNRRRRQRGRDRDNRNGERAVGWRSDPGRGRLDLRSEGYDFLRVNGYIPSRDDAYVPVKLVASTACARATWSPAHRVRPIATKNPALMSVESQRCRPARRPPSSGDLVPVHRPNASLEAVTATMPPPPDRLVLVGKVRRPDRGAAPRWQVDGDASDRAVVDGHHADTHLIILLIDERPEEVTSMCPR